MISQKPNDDQYNILGYEMTEATFREWGGIAQMLVIRDVIPNLEVYPKERRQQMAMGALEKQVGFYEASLDALYKDLTAQAIIMTEAQTLIQMQELNYDLLLGANFLSPVIAD